MPKITPKREKFCRLVAEGKSHSDAYRGAFNAKKMKPRTINVEAFKLMDNPDIANRVKELSVPMVAKVRKTREDVLDAYQAGGWFDTRKMFDTHGNPIDIPNLSDDEAMMLEGFEIFEEFEGRGKDRVPIGFTRKYKLGDRHKYLTSYAKMMGYISDDPPEDPLRASRSITVNFVSETGAKLQLKIGPDGKKRLLEEGQNADPAQRKPIDVNKLGVKFVDRPR